MTPRLYEPMVMHYLQLYFLRQHHEKFERAGGHAMDNLVFVAKDMLEAYMSRADVRSLVEDGYRKGEKPSTVAATIQPHFEVMASWAIEKSTGNRSILT